jgi:hypothetical protein
VWQQQSSWTVSLLMRLQALTGILHAARLAAAIRARGADTDWDHAIAYTLFQITQALNQPQSETPL